MDESNRKIMDQLLNDISEMIKQIETFKGPVTPLKNPDKIKDEVEIIGKFMEAIEGFYDGAKSTDEPIDPENKQLLLKAQGIEQEAKILQQAYSKALSKKNRSKKSKKKEPESEQMKERKKLFKTIGGDKKWIPL